MAKRGVGLLILAVLGGFAGGLASGGLFNPNPVLAQVDPVADVLEKRAQRMREERRERELAQMGALKMQVSPVDPKRCIGISVAIAPNNGATRVFRAFEDGRVELFKQPSALGIEQGSSWGIIGQPGYIP